MPSFVVTLRAVACVVPALLALAGCVLPAGHAPEIGYVPIEALGRLRSPGSSRSEVLMTLGVPDRRFCADRAFRYSWKESVAMVIVPAGYQVGGFSVDEKKNLLIDFDRDGGTRRVDVIGAMTVGALNDKEREWLRKVDACVP